VSTPEPSVPARATSRWLLRRHPDLGRLWAAKAVSQIGDGAALIALVVHVQRTYGTGVAVSALLLAETLPNLLGPFAGTIADRVDQRRLMIATELGQAFLYVAIALLLPPLPLLLVLVAAASVLATAFAPAGRSAIPSLVPQAELVRANAWMAMAITLQGTAGPAVGGGLIAAAGTRGALLGNAATFLIAALFLVRLRELPPEAPDGAPTGVLRETRDGISLALRHRVTRALLVGLGLGVLFAAVDDVALVFLARDELGAGALGYGILAAVYGGGLAIGSIAFRRVRLERAELGFLAGLLLTGIGGIATGLAPVFAVAALTQAIAGAGNGLDLVASDTLVQRSVPRSHRGRVFGVVAATTLLGAAVARGLGGVVLDLTSARTTFVIGGTGVLVATVIAFILFRQGRAAAGGARVHDR
jgi:MFS family permease